jgi:hypothetical protein
LELKHGEEINLECFVITYDKHDSAKSFNAPYEIKIANFPESVKGVLNFILS